MAPKLLGEHQAKNCSNCEFEIVSEVLEPTERFMVCPNCGSRVVAADAANAADEVVLNSSQLPKRWQVIGFQRSGDQQALIKRVVGLPGEKVWFENGNVFLQDTNGETTLLKKNWAQQKATRVLVHDNRFQDQGSRWSPLDPASHAIAALPKQFQTKDRRWLRYQPKRCYEHASGQSWTPRIEDAYGFNQSISRQLNSVNEVCVEFGFGADSGVAQDSKAELLLAIVAGEQTHLARFAYEGNSVDVQLFDRDKEMTAVIPCRVDRGQPVCGISNIDQQIVVAVGGKQVCLFDLERQEFNEPVELLLSLSPSKPIDLKGLRLWRDAYYFSSVGREELLQRQAAGAEGYFVVGDNLPVSRDSRFWPRPRVDVRDILGVVDIGQ